MISAARVLGLATATATLLVAGGLSEPAGAQGEVCKDGVVTAVGRAKFRPFTKTKELEGRGAAMGAAGVHWEKEVRTNFGGPWTSCDKTKIIGSSFIGCTISGRPCSAPGAAKKDGDVADRDRRRDRDRGDDRGRTRDRDRRDTLAGIQQRAYERAMAHQDYLADQRRKADARAWKREDAYHKYLANKRRRIERAQKAWEARMYRRYQDDDRYRYYDRHRYYDRYRHYHRYRDYNRHQDYSRYSAYGRYREYDYAFRVYSSYYYFPDFHDLREYHGDRRWSPEDRHTGGRAWWRRMDREGRGGHGPQ